MGAVKLLIGIIDYMIIFRALIGLRSSTHSLIRMAYLAYYVGSIKYCIENSDLLIAIIWFR